MALCTATGRLALFSDNRSKAALVKVTIGPCCIAVAMQLTLGIFVLHSDGCLLVGSARTSSVLLTSTARCSVQAIKSSVLSGLVGACSYSCSSVQ